MLKKRFFKTIDECEVTFQVDPDAGDSVELLIESNDWEPIEMKKAKNGPFKTKLRLPLDSHVQFRYLADGENWLNDDEADRFATNEFGGQNSVVVTARNGSG